MVPSCINVININALENHKHVHISDKKKKKRENTNDISFTEYDMF
jgi:hypothetical protein